MVDITRIFKDILADRQRLAEQNTSMKMTLTIIANGPSAYMTAYEKEVKRIAQGELDKWKQK